MKVDMRMAYVRAQLISGWSLWRKIDIRNLNRRNHGGKMKIDMRMAEHYSLMKTKTKKHMED